LLHRKDAPFFILSSTTFGYSSRMGRCSASSSEGLGNNSGVKIIGICTEPGARNGKKYIQAYELSEEFAGNEAPIVGAYAVIP